MDVVRALTLNLWGDHPPLGRRLELVAEAIRANEVDLVALQAVRVHPGELPNTAETVAGRLGWGCAYAKAYATGDGDEGLAILARLPIANAARHELPSAGASEKHIVLGAAVETPLGELPVFVTHLSARLTDSARRQDQVAAVDAFVANWRKERRPPLPALVMGCFNAPPDADEIRFLRGLHAINGHSTYYQDAWARRRPNETGHTWSSRNPSTEALHWIERDRRVDYVFVSPVGRDGRGRIRDCQLLLNAPSQDGVWASGHFGVLAEVQLGPTM